MIVLALVSAVLVGAASIVLFSGSIDNLLRRYLLPLTVACATASASGESEETKGLLIAGFIVMVTLRAIDESAQLELPVIWLSILSILATFGYPAAVAQVASVSMIIVDLAFLPKTGQSEYEDLQGKFELYQLPQVP